MQYFFFTGVSFLSYVMFQGDSNEANIPEYVQSEGNSQHFTWKDSLKFSSLRFWNLYK